MIGTIRCIKAAGFGFIDADGDGGRGQFFHEQDLIGLEFGEHLTEMRVEFESRRGPK